MGEACYVYRALNKDGETIYIGMSKDVPARLSQHRYASSWHEEVEKIELERHPSRIHAEIAEREAILREKPKHNIATLPPRDLDSTSYAEDATPAERAKLERLRKKRDASKDEYNAFRRKVKNRIDQARWRARQAQDK